LGVQAKEQKRHWSKTAQLQAQQIYRNSAYLTTLKTGVLEERYDSTPDLDDDLSSDKEEEEEESEEEILVVTNEM
jgi:hypothetical protein